MGALLDRRVAEKFNPGLMTPSPETGNKAIE
jgi:hypothetical protein